MATRLGFGRKENDKKLYSRFDGDGEYNPFCETSINFSFNQLKHLNSMHHACNTNNTLSNKNRLECQSFCHNGKRMQNKNQITSPKCENIVNISNSLTRPSIHSQKKDESSLNEEKFYESEGSFENGFPIDANFPSKDLYFNSILANAPFILMSASVVFFGIIVYLYLYFRYNTVVFNDPRDDFLVCPKNQYESNECILKYSEENVKKILANILTETSLLSGKEKCGEREDSLMMVEDMKKFIGVSEPELNFLLFLKLFESNPHWGVLLLDNNQQPVENLEHCFYILNTNYVLSWSCKISNICSKCAYIFILLLFLFISFSTVRFVQTYLEWRIEADNIEVDNVMENIIDLLKSQATISAFSHGSNIDAWIDEDLIYKNLSNREESQIPKKIWNRALKILKQNESKLAFKKIQRDQKEVSMMRWMTYSSSCTNKKVPSQKHTSPLVHTNNSSQATTPSHRQTSLSQQENIDLFFTSFDTSQHNPSIKEDVEQCENHESLKTKQKIDVNSSKNCFQQNNTEGSFFSRLAQHQVNKKPSNCAPLQTSNQCNNTQNSNKNNHSCLHLFTYTQTQKDSDTSQEENDQSYNKTPLKCWQGSAITGPKNCYNSSFVPTPLTKCLKIRGMLEDKVSNPSSRQFIKDAILEKVGDRHNILQIAIDSHTKESCVYLRCGDVEGAGEVFTKLHGWWFDNRLVTVKYIKLKRFFERFPEDSDNKTPLTPSNNKRLSLCIPPFKSVLEDT